MPERPDQVPKLDPLRRIGEDQKLGGATGQDFEKFMQKAEGAMPSSSAGKPAGISPFDLAGKQSLLATGPNFDTVLNQVKSAQNMLGDMTNDLHTKNLKLKQSQKSVLRSKLKNANTHLKAANEKLGAPIPDKKEEGKGGGIFGQFLNYIADGQNNLVAAQKQLLNLKTKGAVLQPADFLAIQIKLNHAQQEIEYASVMLGKAVDSIKTLMNIQL